MKEAVISNNIERVKSLLAEGIDINARDSVGHTLLMCASRKGHVDISQQLLAVSDIEVNTQDRKGKTALMYALESGHAVVVKQLLAVPGIDYNCCTKLICAAMNGDIDVSQQLLAAPGINVNAQDWIGRTALMYASMKGHTTMVKQLLAVPGIEVNAQDRRGKTALMYAAESGHAAVIKQLLAVPGVEVNAQDLIGCTALMCASMNGHATMVKQLLAVPGIEVNAKDSKGHTALMHSSIIGHTDVAVQLLVAPDLDVNVQSSGGKTALMHALMMDHADVAMQLLVMPGIEVNAQDQVGRTALMYAAEEGHIVIVKLLSNRLTEAEINLSDNHGKSSCTVATADVLKYLMYSGKVLFSDAKYLLDLPSAIVKLQNLYSNIPNKIRPRSGYSFLVGVQAMLSSLSALVAGDAVATFLKRINLLAARVCGVAFSDDVTVNHSGMSIEKFRVISYLMRVAVLTKLEYGHNLYLSIASFMFNENNCGMHLDIKTNILSFLSSGDVACFAKDMAIVEKEKADSRAASNTAAPAATN